MPDILCEYFGFILERLYSIAYRNAQVYILIHWLAVMYHGIVV